MVLKMYRKKIFYISDLHLYSEGVINKSNRPFKNAEKMTEMIIKNWEKKVRKWDIVYVLGDVCKYNFPGGKLKEIFRKLPGEKHLILGNHDNIYMYKKALSQCFLSVTKYARIKDEDHIVILSHYPFESWDGKDFQNTIHLHGHVHGYFPEQGFEKLNNIPNRFNVAADFTNFTPVTLNELLQKQD